jgi:hypothetical protein
MADINNIQNLQDLKEVIAEYLVTPKKDALTAAQLNIILSKSIEFSTDTSEIFSAINNIAAGSLGAVPSDVPVANINVYKALTTGTYGNMGGLTVSTEDLAAGDVQLVRGVSGTFLKRIVPNDLLLYPKKAELQYKGTFDSLALAINGVLLSDRKLGDTVGIKENGSVVEYWWRDGVADADLTKKTVDVSEIKDEINTLQGIKNHTFPENLPVIVWNYMGSAPLTIATTEDPIQTHSSSTLNLLFKHGASDYAFLDTGLAIANNKDFAAFELTFKPDALVSSPAFGLAFGDASTKDWLCAFYRQDGSLSGINLNEFSTVKPIRAANTELAYVIGDTITVEYRADTGIVRTSKNGVYAPDLNIGLKTGKVYIIARGSNNSSIKTSLLERYETPSSKELGQAIDGVTISINKTFEQLPFKPYLFQGFDLSNIVAQSTGAINTTYNVSKDGLDINHVSAIVPIFYSNLDFDNSNNKYEMSIRHEIISLGTNPMIGMAFGSYGVNTHAFAYRQDGSFSFDINGSFSNPRAATPSLAFNVGDTIGLDFTVDKSAGTVTVKSVLNGVVHDTPYKISPADFSNLYLYLRGASRTYVTALITIASNSSIVPNQVFYVNPYTGSNTNSGSEAMPFKTITKAIASCVGLLNSKIILTGGIYRESANFSVLSNENVEIVAQTPDVVEVFGSDQIVGFSKTALRTNVYEATFSGTIINQSRAGALIYEHGKPSDLIAPSDRHALQRGLTHRFPFSTLKAVAGVVLCDATPGSYYYEVASTKIYIHPNDSTDPNTNGYTYENIVRGGVISPTFSATRKANISLKNIRFMYNTGVAFSGFNKVERYMCAALGSSGSGCFIDNNSFTISYKDEVGFGDGDCLNGHYSSVPGYTTKDQRDGVMNGLYIDPWCKRSFDDGLSFHERSDTTIWGGLFEYNGDGGVRQSNDAIMRVYYALSRRNGWDTSAGTKGSGFDMVNEASANRLPGVLELHGCISEYNRNGIGIVNGEGTLNAYDCTTRNNTDSEYFAASGVVNASNCKATNSTPSKIKVITSTGVINVLNDALLV